MPGQSLTGPWSLLWTPENWSSLESELPTTSGSFISRERGTQGSTLLSRGQSLVVVSGSKSPTGSFLNIWSLVLFWKALNVLHGESLVEEGDHGGRALRFIA